MCVVVGGEHVQSYFYARVPFGGVRRRRVLCLCKNVCMCVVRASKCICRKTFQFARTCERAPTAENSVELIKYSTVARVHTHEYIKYNIKYKCIAHLYCCREVVNTVTVEKYTFIEIHLHALDG